MLAGLMRELSKKELSDLILTNQESMYRMAVSMLGSDADAQDAVSESITRAFENRCRLRDKRKGKIVAVGNSGERVKGAAKQTGSGDPDGRTGTVYKECNN